MLWLRMILLSLLLRYVPVHAASWSPYVGGALQYDVAFAHYHLKSLTHSGTLHDFGCWGSQWEAGFFSPAFSIYGGYHFAASPVYVRESAVYIMNGTDQQVASLVEENAWQEKRALVGFRWHLNGSGDYPVKPVVGFALSYGRTRLGWVQTQRSYPSERLTTQTNVSRRSSFNLGQMVEFGFLIQTKMPLAVTLLAQCHRYEADFGMSVPYVPADHYVVLLPGVHVGMQYAIPSLSIGK